MIRRRRANEDGEGTATMEGGSDHHFPSALSNGTASMDSTMNDETTSRKTCCTGHNKRTILFLSIILIGFVWNFLSAKRLFDISTYGLFREYYKKQPGIAWLMTFPNSGTSYTMNMVAESTNKSFATNYGKEVIAPDEANSFSIYPRRPEGPYWPGLSGKRQTPRDLPDRFVITKTHCGSRCSTCGPYEYIETTEKFLTRCATSKMIKGANGMTYSPDWVKRAIHLFRNPMHNVIARYHLEHHKNDKKWQDDHSNDSEGLHKWCKGTKKTYEQEDIAFFGSKEAIPKATCHGEFYKWTQWHNLAEQSIRQMRDGGLSDGPRRDVPVLKVFYEDYNNAFEQTANSILDFLELKQVAPFPNFTSRSDYEDYFPLDELIEIKNLVKSVATNAVWTDVKHYFEGVPDVKHYFEGVPDEDYYYYY